jgi:uncharacterized protein with ParB-like and HNH nuclease domain
MKATETKFLEFLRKSPQHVISIYQRSCSWGKRECKQLWDDIIWTGRDDDAPAHFAGSIVYVMSLIRQSFEKQIDEIPRRSWYLLT